MSSAAQLGGLLARVELFEDTVREKRKSAALLQCTTAAHSAEATPREKAGLMMAALRSGCECERSSLLLVDEVRGQLCVVSEDEDAAGESKGGVRLAKVAVRKEFSLLQFEAVDGD